ncbi:hypothetical protein SKA53_00549 [Yoonia vestfoldensis SKA53]|uniref:Uncharacterized protein n=1 Tax=Yoonia vestfoldensis SKA53 TaxID=314232 RepID=A3V878_9RHOB|nr:hypothetical protein [Yoonia vestfoldensis]EAQ05530.1 hypothetical protein SKA53_00549 [Yoonia vestfoldensis SKA53]
MFSWFYLPNNGLFTIVTGWFGFEISGGVLGTNTGGMRITAHPLGEDQ